MIDLQNVKVADHVSQWRLVHIFFFMCPVPFMSRTAEYDKRGKQLLPAVHMLNKSIVF